MKKHSKGLIQKALLLALLPTFAASAWADSMFELEWKTMDNKILSSKLSLENFEKSVHDISLSQRREYLRDCMEQLPGQISTIQNFTLKDRLDPIRSHFPNFKIVLTLDEKDHESDGAFPIHIRVEGVDNLASNSYELECGHHGAYPPAAPVLHIIYDVKNQSQSQVCQTLTKAQGGVAATATNASTPGGACVH